MHKETNKPFGTKYNTWIIAYSPDTDSFFVTNERNYYWELDKEFKNEDEGIEYFKENLNEFKTIHEELRKDNSGIPKREKVFLENLLTWL